MINEAQQAIGGRLERGLHVDEITGGFLVSVWGPQGHQRECVFSVEALAEKVRGYFSAPREQSTPPTERNWRGAELQPPERDGD